MTNLQLIYETLNKPKIKEIEKKANKKKMKQKNQIIKMILLRRPPPLPSHPRSLPDPPLLHLLGP